MLTDYFIMLTVNLVVKVEDQKQDSTIASIFATPGLQDRWAVIHTG